MSEIEEEIKSFQKNLQVIRRIAGWTTEELGDRIGVTKQTISNLENDKTTMTKTQYIALLAVFNYEIATNAENKALEQVINVPLSAEEEDDLPDEEAEEKSNNSTVEEDKRSKKASTNKAKAASVGKAVAKGSVFMAASLSNPVLLGCLAKAITSRRK